MKTVSIGQSQTDNYKGKTIVGLYVLMQVTASKNNVALSNTDLLLRSTKVNVDLKRNHMTKSILGTTYDVLLKVCNYEDAPVKALWGINQAIPVLAAPYPAPGGLDPNLSLSSDAIIGVAGAGAPDQRLLCASYYFNSPINLEADDELMITVNASAGTIVAAGNASSGAQTFFGFDVIEGEGAENGLPIMLVENIQQGQGTVKVAPGHGAHRSFFINTDHTDMTLTNAIIDTVTVHSEKGGYNRQFIELLQVRSNERPGYYDDFHFNDFKLWDEHDTQDLNITLQLNVAQVTNANNYVVTFKSEHDKHSRARYELKHHHMILKKQAMQGTLHPQGHTQMAQIAAKLAQLK